MRASLSSQPGPLARAAGSGAHLDLHVVPPALTQTWSERKHDVTIWPLQRPGVLSLNVAGAVTIQLNSDRQWKFSSGLPVDRPLLQQSVTGFDRSLSVGRDERLPCRTYLRPGSRSITAETAKDCKLQVKHNNRQIRLVPRANLDHYSSTADKL